MLQRRVELVCELVSWSSAPRAFRASTLNHELRDHPVKTQPIVEIALFFFAGLLVGKFLGSFGEPDKILHRLGRFFFQQADHNIALRSLKNCIRTCGSAHACVLLLDSIIVHDPHTLTPPGRCAASGPDFSTSPSVSATP